MLTSIVVSSAGEIGVRFGMPSSAGAARSHDGDGSHTSRPPTWLPKHVVMVLDHAERAVEAPLLTTVMLVSFTEKAVTHRGHARSSTSPQRGTVKAWCT